MLQGMKYHHVGIACEDIDRTASQYESMGYVRGERIIDPIQNIEICFLEHEDMPRLELLGAVNDKSPVVEILKKNGTSSYHICYSVDNIEDSVKQLRKQRFVVVSKPQPACALDNHRVSFLFHKDVGLIELVEN